MKKLFLTILLFFAIQATQAQAHQMGAKYNCKLKKGSPNTEGYPCPACTAIYKKEQNAKIAEDKRRFAAIQAEAEAKKVASEKVRLAKLAEEKKNAESGKVYINAQKNTVVTNNQIEKKTSNNETKVKNVTNKTVMIGLDSWLKHEGTFKNEKGEIILENKNWIETYSLPFYSVTNNCPSNVGIVNYQSSRGVRVKNIVNSKGEYLFNDSGDDEISHIAHIKDGWLIAGNYNFKNSYLYNINTGKKITIGNYPIQVNSIDQINEIFMPIFSNSVELNKDVIHYLNKEWMMKEVKEKLINWFPNIINEEMLSKYSFVLRATNSYDKRYSGKKEIFDETKTILLCVTKNGELEVINLK
ncbi:MAG TPA: hypothetical protein PLD18_02590 [Flavobacterium sp.]|nr:hypothetical protein [Flavobacterium sp.]